MTTKFLTRLTIAALLLGSLGACAVVPYPAGYRSGPVYVESYPGYRYGPSPYYGRDRGYDEHRGGGYYREERRYDDHRRIESPLETAARTHRDIRRSLGLPRLPGMP